MRDVVHSSTLDLRVYAGIGTEPDTVGTSSGRISLVIAGMRYNYLRFMVVRRSGYKRCFGVLVFYYSLWYNNIQYLAQSYREALSQGIGVQKKNAQTQGDASLLS